MLVGLQMNNILEDGPLAGNDLPADLFIRETIN
jgi:hypothetical protein